LPKYDIDVIDLSKLVTLDEVGQRNADIDIINETVDEIVITGSAEVNDDIFKTVSTRDIIG